MRRDRSEIPRVDRGDYQCAQGADRAAAAGEQDEATKMRDECRKEHHAQPNAQLPLITAAPWPSHGISAEIFHPQKRRRRPAPKCQTPSILLRGFLVVVEFKINDR